MYSTVRFGDGAEAPLLGRSTNNRSGYLPYDPGHTRYLLQSATCPVVRRGQPQPQAATAAASRSSLPGSTGPFPSPAMKANASSRPSAS